MSTVADAAVPAIAMRIRLRRWVVGGIVALAALAPIVLFFVVPLVDVIIRSLTPSGTLSFTEHITLAHYRSLLSDSGSRLILRNTFLVALEACVITLILAYPVAMQLARLPRRKALLVAGLFLLPSWSSFIVSLYGLSLLLQPLGLMYTHWGSVIGMVNYLLPLMVVMLYSTMASIDGQLMASAQSLGASWIRAFLRVFMPLTRTGVFASSLIIFIIGLAFFLTPAILGGPADITAALFIEQEIRVYDWGGAAAMGITLLLIATVLYAFVAVVSGVDRLGGANIGGQRGATRVDDRWPAGVTWFLRLWTLLAVAFIFAPLAALLPASVNPSAFLSLHPRGVTFHWYATAIHDPGWQAAGWLSLKAAIITAVAATAIGLAGAFTLTRLAGRTRPFLRLLYVGPLIVPVILYAIAVFDLETRLKMTSTTMGYALAHTIMALPFTVTILTEALESVGRDYEDAAQTLGAPPITALWRTTLRLITPGLVSAAALAFFLSWGETVVALILAGARQTLPVRIYSFMQVELTPETAALGMMMSGAVLVLGFVFLGGSRFFTRKQQLSAVLGGARG